jgi:hypothetical protein
MGALLAGPVPPWPLPAGALLAGVVVVLAAFVVHPASRHKLINAGPAATVVARARPPRRCLIAFITAELSA